MIQKIKEMFHTIGFWFLVCMLIGSWVGGFTMHTYHKYRMKEAILLQGFIFDKQIYEIKIKP